MKQGKKTWLLLSVMLISALLLSACGGSATTGGEATGGLDCMGASEGDEVTVAYQFAAEEEESFAAAIGPVLDACGIVLVPESTRDQALIDTRVNAGDPYDMVVWPNVGPVASYGDALVSIDDAGGDSSNYSAAWTHNAGGNWMAVAVKADPKSIVWYSPVAFDAAGYDVPSSFADFQALADQMVSDGVVPFSMGFESGDATGWTASDFIQDILLATEGPDYVSGIIDGSVAYDDSGVANAYEIYSNWATDGDYAVGGSDGSLSTGFLDAIIKPFADPPEAMMVKQSGFAGGIVAEQFPELEYGTDFAFFPFPGAQAVQGGSDWLMVFNASPAVQAIVAYITSADGGANWASTGFGLSPNGGSEGNYADATNADLAATLTNASAATGDLGDSIQPTFPTAEWTAIVDIISGASDIGTALAAAAAAQADDLGN